MKLIKYSGFELYRLDKAYAEIPDSIAYHAQRTNRDAWVKRYFGDILQNVLNERADEFGERWLNASKAERQRTEEELGRRMWERAVDRDMSEVEDVRFRVAYMMLSDDARARKSSGQGGEKGMQKQSELSGAAPTEEQRKLGEAMAGLVKKAGIEVVTDMAEMERALGESGEAQAMNMLSRLAQASVFIRRGLAENKAEGKFQLPLPKAVERLIRIRAKEKGITLTDAQLSHLLSIGGLRHGMNNHGVGGRKIDESSIPLRAEDMELAPYIMTAPHRVEVTIQDRGRMSVRFIRQLSNGMVVVVEKENINDPHSMETINMWADTSSNVADARSGKLAPGLTSENVTISGDDAAKIRKDAEQAILRDAFLQKMTAWHGSGRTQFLRTRNGEVYGFVKEGKMYLDPALMNPNTPVHEYTHLWDNALRTANPKLWARGKELMREMPLWDEVKNDPAYADIAGDEDLLASEVHARLSGPEGARLLERMVTEAKSRGAIEMAKAVTLRERVKKWLGEALAWVRDAFGGKWSKEDLASLTVEEWSSMPVRDLAQGVNPLREGGEASKCGETQRMIMGERGAAALDKKDGGKRMKDLDDAKEWEKMYKELEGNPGERERVQKAAKAVREMAPVEVKAGSFPKDKADAKAAYDAIGDVTNKATGQTVNFYRSAFKKNHREGGLFERAIPGLRESFERSVMAYSEVDAYKGKQRPDGTTHKGHANVESYDNYVGKVSLDGNEYYVRYTVQSNRGGEAGAHSMFVTDVELYNNAGERVNDTEFPSGRTPSDGVVDAKLQRFFALASGNAHDFRQALRFATGWERGADGKWRWEEMDGGLRPEIYGDLQKLDSTINESPTKRSHKVTKLLGDVLADCPAFEAYPQLRNYQVTLKQVHYQDEGGSFNPKTKSITICSEMFSTPTYLRSVYGSLIHEVQHAIQHIEGFAKGSSPIDATMRLEEMMGELKSKMDAAWGKYQPRFDAASKSKDPYGETRKALADFSKEFPQYEAWEREYDRLSDIREGSMEEIYHAVMGEVEARNASERLLWSEKERRAKLLEDSEDVARDAQVVLMEQSGPSLFIGKRARAEYERLLERKRPDMPEDMRRDALDYLHSLEDTKEENRRVKIAVHWLASSEVNLPNDMHVIDKAIKVADAAKVDPMRYSSPQELLRAHSEVRVKEKPIDPDKVPQLTNKRELADGLVVYDVEDTKAGQAAMREVINTHWGEDANPWCLLQGDGEGNLTEMSWGYWQTYNGMPKQVAFKDGKLLAFRGIDVYTDSDKAYADGEATWWDRQDKNSVGIPVGVRLGGGRRGVRDFNPVDGKWGEVRDIERGNQNDGKYEAWWREGVPKEESEWKAGEAVGTHRWWSADGKLQTEMTFNDNGFRRTVDYHDNGEVKREYDWDLERKCCVGEKRIYYRDGGLYEATTYDDNGKIRHYRTYHANRAPEQEIHYDEAGEKHGVERWWNNGGQLLQRIEHEHGETLLREQFDRDGKLRLREEAVGSRMFREDWGNNPFAPGSYRYTRISTNGETRKWHVDADGAAREIVNGEPVGEVVRGVERGRERDQLAPEQWNGGLLFRTLERDERVRVDEVSEGMFEVGVDPEWSVVGDKELVERLESGPKRKAYAAMLLIDGKLYPPMSSQEARGRMRKPSELGRWEESEERPDKIQRFKAGKNGEKQGQFLLLKDNGKSVPAAYNPYFHQSDWALNDQFSSAWDRPNLVVVEVEIPESEMAGDYKAKYAKDATGLADWKDGGLTREMGGREVYLSRWRKPVRVLSDAEVAELVSPRLKKHGVGVPFNVVAPGLRDALSAKGVEIVEPEKGAAGNASLEAWEEYRRGSGEMRFSERRGDDNRKIDLPELEERVQQWSKGDKQRAQIEICTSKDMESAEFLARISEGLEAPITAERLKEEAKNAGALYLGRNEKIVIFADGLTEWALRNHLRHEEIHHQLYIHPDTQEVLPELIVELSRKYPEAYRLTKVYYPKAGTLELADEMITEVLAQSVEYDVVRELLSSVNPKFHDYINTLLKATDYGEKGDLAKSERREVSSRDKGGVLEGYGTHQETLGRTKGGQGADRGAVGAKRQAAERMGSRLNTGATIVDTVEGLRELDVYRRANRETRAMMEARPGFFDPRTGQIVINLERCRDAADVAATVLHETAGHYGLRELVAKLGDKEGATPDEKNELMSRWCMDLYERLDGKTRAEVARAAARNGWRLDVAVEERMSELAEIPEGKMTADERGVWNRVRAWAKRLLMDVFGIDHLPKWVKLTDAELRYMVKRSRLNLENRGLRGDPMEVAEDIVLRQDLGLDDHGGDDDGPRGGGGMFFTSKRRDDRKETNDVIDQATSFITGRSVKEMSQRRQKKAAERRVRAREMYEKVLRGEFDDVTLRAIEEYINESTPENPYGRRVSERLPQAVARKVESERGLAAVDALFSRICESAVRPNERFGSEGRRKIEERKKEALKGWAQATGHWHTDLSEFTDNPTPIGRGTDSDVYLGKDGL